MRIAPIAPGLMEITARFAVRDYDLAATLTSGQAFRWREVGGAWQGVIHGRWVQLRQISSSRSVGAEPAPFEVQCSRFNVRRCPLSSIEATTAHHEPRSSRREEAHFEPDPRWSLLTSAAAVPGVKARIVSEESLPASDWRWLTDYLRLADDLAAQLATFPNDAPMRAAVAHCFGLRLLRQEPWECLASFILSSTKQIVQIQQCIALLCERFGEPVMTGGTQTHPQPLPRGEPDRARPTAGSPPGRGQGWVAPGKPAWFAFPSATRLASATEAELRACKIGFRAKYLHAAARIVAAGEVKLDRIPSLPPAAAREELMRIPGVGPKIADCALLFSCGFDAAFPIDVWVERALRQLYFPRRRVKRARIERFAANHFGPHAGLAQQYLFHYLRTGRDELNL